jgi:hypothetical protein
MSQYDRPKFTAHTYFHWMVDNWQYFGIVVGIYLTIYLTVAVLPQSTLYYALLMLFPLYILHETEEYILPGGFPEFANKRIFHADRDDDLVPLDKLGIFWVNVGYVWLPIPLFTLLSLYDIRFAIWIPYYLIFQAIIHVVMGIMGKKLVNPGLFSAWLVHVPVSIWILVMLHTSGYLASYVLNIYVLIGLLVNLIFPIVGFGILVPRYNKKVQGGQVRQPGMSMR